MGKPSTSSREAMVGNLQVASQDTGARRFAFGCVLAFAAMGSAPAATLTVTGTGDTIAVDGLVTLREAITSANNDANVNADVVAVGAYGTDTIKFNIPGAGVKTIAPTSTLPAITDPLTIDGYTQPGSSVNTLAVGDNAILRIQLTGRLSSTVWLLPAVVRPFAAWSLTASAA